MWKVECLDNYGSWCRKYRIRKICNWLADAMEKKGHIKKLEFLGNQTVYSKKFLKGKIKIHKEKIEYYKHRLKLLEQKENK